MTPSEVLNEVAECSVWLWSGISGPDLARESWSASTWHPRPSTLAQADHQTGVSSARAVPQWGCGRDGRHRNVFEIMDRFAVGEWQGEVFQVLTVVVGAVAGHNASDMCDSSKHSDGQTSEFLPLSPTLSEVFVKTIFVFLLGFFVRTIGLCTLLHRHHGFLFVVVGHVGRCVCVLCVKAGSGRWPLWGDRQKSSVPWNRYQPPLSFLPFVTAWLIRG